MSFKRILLFFLYFFHFSLATQATQLKEIKIIASARDMNEMLDTRTPETIKLNQYETPTTLLNTHPSMQLIDQGGALTLSLRGTKSDQNVMLLNGMPLNDPSINNLFDYNNLEVETIETLRVITGAEALYYGSGAVGGVIKVTTKKASPGSCAALKGEVGSFKTAKMSGNLNYRHNNTGLHTSLTRSRTGEGKRWNPDHNTYNSDYNSSTRGSVMVDYSFHKHHTLEAFATGRMDKAWMDRFSSTGLLQEGGHRLYHHSFAGILKNTFSSQKNTWHHHFLLGHYQNRRHYKADSLNTYVGERHLGGYEGEGRLSETVGLEYGLDYQRETNQSYQVSRQGVDFFACKSRATFSPREDMDLFVSGRLDKHQKFKESPSFQTGGQWELFPTFKLLASLGTGFKSPSLQDFLGSPYQAPNPQAQPEKTFLWDVGLEKQFPAQGLAAKMTYFNIQVTDVLVWDPTGRQRRNKDARNAQGLEAALTYTLNSAWSCLLSYTYTHAIDSKPKTRSTQIASHKGTLTLNYTFSPSLTAFGEAVYQSRQKDFNTYWLRESLLIRIGLQKKFYENLTGFARFENLLNQRHDTSYSLSRRGFGFFTGFKLTTGGLS